MRMVLIDFAGKLGWQVLAYPNTCIKSQISMTKIELSYLSCMIVLRYIVLRIGFLSWCSLIKLLIGDIPCWPTCSILQNGSTSPNVIWVGTTCTQSYTTEYICMHPVVTAEYTCVPSHIRRVYMCTLPFTTEYTCIRGGRYMFPDV